jgi:NADH-quinone oxidoreductase subunit J
VPLESIFFFAVGTAAIIFAVLMVIQKNPLMSAIFLIGNFFCLALLYLLLRAQLLAILQILVYTGAIMVLVVFVIMLLNLGDEKRLTERFDLRRMLGLVLVLGFLIEIIYLVGGGGVRGLPLQPASAELAVGTVESVGAALFGKFLLPFELISLLLLVAIIGAVVLARKREGTKT